MGCARHAAPLLERAALERAVIVRRPFTACQGSSPLVRQGAAGKGAPAATDSPGRLPAQYHGRWRGARPCSGWERVFLLRHSHRNGLSRRLAIAGLVAAEGESSGTRIGAARRMIRGAVKASTDSYRSAEHVAVRTPPADQPGGLPGVLPCQAGGRPHLGEGFALRCFQRLSRPDTATQRCAWRHSWDTGGRSTPVL